MPAIWGAAIAGAATLGAAAISSSSKGSSSSGGGSSGGGTSINENNFSGGGLITPAASLAGSIEQGQIAQQTADTQSADIATGQTQANAILDPYNTSGTSADKQLADLQGLNGPEAATAAMAKFQESPGYAYQVSQGLRAVDAGAAGKGMLRSGQTLKEEQTLGNNLADQDFGGYITRLNNLITPGLTAGGGIASTDTSAAGAQSKIAGTLGTNLANTAGATTGAIGSLVTAGINGLSNIGKGLAGLNFNFGTDANGDPLPPTPPGDPNPISATDPGFTDFGSADNATNVLSQGYPA